MNGVIDCSAAVEIALKRERCDELRSKCNSFSRIFVPDFFRIEFANVLWKTHRAKQIETWQIDDARFIAENIPSDFVSNKELIAEALQESIFLNHPVYDTLYLVLARRNDAVLLTLDKRLQTLAQMEGITVYPKGKN